MVSMVLFVLVYGYAGPPGVGVVAVRGGRAFMGDGSCMMRPCVRIDGGIYTFAARVARGRRLVTCRRADARARERHFDAPTRGDDRLVRRRRATRRDPPFDSVKRMFATAVGTRAPAPAPRAASARAGNRRSSVKELRVARDGALGDARGVFATSGFYANAVTTRGDVARGAGARGRVVMAAKVAGYIKLAIEAGKASPAPPIGPALGAQVRGRACDFVISRARGWMDARARDGARDARGGSCGKTLG